MGRGICRENIAMLQKHPLFWSYKIGPQNTCFWHSDDVTPAHFLTPNTIFWVSETHHKMVAWKHMYISIFMGQSPVTMDITWSPTPAVLGHKRAEIGRFMLWPFLVSCLFFYSFFRPKTDPPKPMVWTAMEGLCPMNTWVQDTIIIPYIWVVFYAYVYSNIQKYVHQRPKIAVSNRHPYFFESLYSRFYPPPPRFDHLGTQRYLK